MPRKRRLAKGRDQLSAGQLLFLQGVRWPADDADYGNGGPGARYMESMRHCWLSQPHRTGTMPDDSASAAELWQVYGEQITRDWIMKNPGSRPRPWWRFSAPIVREDGDAEVTRHHLLTSSELRRRDKGGGA